MAVGQPQLNHVSPQELVSLCIHYIILDLKGSTQPPTPEAVEKYETKVNKDPRDLPSEIWMRIKKERGDTKRIPPPCLETLREDAGYFLKETGAEDRLYILRLQDSECLRPANTQQGQEPGLEGGEVDAGFIVALAVWLSENRIWPDFGAREVTKAMLWEVVEKAKSYLGVSCSFTLHSSVDEAN